MREKIITKIVGLFFLFLGLGCLALIIGIKDEPIDIYRIFIYIFFLIGFLFFMLGFLVSFFPKFGDKIDNFESKIRKSNKCKVCGKEAYEKLSKGFSSSETYCRIHLIENYKKELLISPYDYLIVEFQENAPSRTLDYGYYPISEMKKYGWKDNDKLILQKILDKIKISNCSKCSKKAKVLFVSSEDAPYKKFGPNLKDEFINSGDLLCPEHAVFLTIPSLDRSKKRLNNFGIGVPYKEDGFMVTTEV